MDHSHHRSLSSSSPHNQQHSQYRLHRSMTPPSTHRGHHPPTKDGTPHFYQFLCKNKKAFKDATFLLPQLKRALQALSSSSGKDKIKKEQQEDKKASNADTPKRGGRHGRYNDDCEPTEAESSLARRRIVSAVCAFGGTFIGSRMNNNHASDPSDVGSNNSVVPSSTTSSNKRSIFREKAAEPATVTPSSSGASSSVAVAVAATTTTAITKMSREQARYDSQLPTRYYESDNRLSWEFEENPPIGRSSLSSKRKQNSGGNNDCGILEGGKTPSKKRRTGDDGEGVTIDDSENESKDGNDDDDASTTSSKKIKDKNEDGKDGEGSSPDNKKDAKLRYRCKLCGQPKTNHVCPYQSSLVRSIGAMVHPAVNAFTAAEPGRLAPDLKEMNNLAISAAAIAAQANANANANNVTATTNPEQYSPVRGLPTPDRSSSRAGKEGEGGSTAGTSEDAATTAGQVTPESTVRSGNVADGTPSSVSTSGGGGVMSPMPSGDLKTPQRGASGTPGSRSDTPATCSSNGPPLSSSSTASNSSSRKRSHSKMLSNNNGASGAAGDQNDLLFVEEMELKPEQFRLVTPSKIIDDNPDAFTYPALPLPYAQRKRLSDNLFSLSKEIPQLTDECASVLREARERDLWDLAVAELMTQVVVVVHCPDNDTSFEGLRRYLLTLGFTC